MIAPSPSPTPDARAEDIFARTRMAFAARTYPSTIKYAVRISGYRNGAWIDGRSYVSYEDWPDGSIFARSISEEEAANPVKPPPFCFFGIGAPKRAGLELPGILGFPHLAVTYAFGLADRPPKAAAPATDTSSGLKLIGTVRAVVRHYVVTLAGEEAVDGNPCYHLSLRPLGNPGTYRVRDLWVDETSYQTRKLVTDGNFTSKDAGSGRWTVTYSQSGDSWYLSAEVSDGPIAGYDRVAVQFVDVEADPHENLDFGLSGASHDAEIDEPDDDAGRS